MAELRWNPLLQDWVMIASHRQERPQMPKDWCPFCPEGGKVPPDYDVYAYDNDFPALSLTPPSPDDVATDFFRTEPTYGKCEVILYSPKHTITMSQLSDEHMKKLVDLWCERFDALAQDEEMKYIFIFENRGEAVGVTMPHPHGQIYAYSFLPKKLGLEHTSSLHYAQRTGECLFCTMLKKEQEANQRILFENEHFTVFLPFYSEYPYGIMIMPKSHKQFITDLDETEKFALGVTLRDASGMLDYLFDYPFPYMMCMHNAPIHCGNMNHFHFHIEFFSPMRSKEKQKFNASSETGAWAHCNPTSPETCAEELRQAYQKFIKNQ